MMHQAAFPTRIPEMNKKLKDLIWHTRKLDKTRGTVLFIPQDRRFSLLNTFIKLHFSKLDPYFQLWILFIFIFLFYVLFKFIYLLLSKRDLKPSVSSVFNSIAPCGSPIIFHVYNSYPEIQQINHETENWNVNMPTDFMIPVKEH